MNRFLLITMAVLALIFPFQNCGEVSLDAPTEVVVIESKSLSVEGNFCTAIGPSFGTPVKFIFILDMSISNLGGARPFGPPSANNDYNWKVGAEIDPCPDNNDPSTCGPGQDAYYNSDFVTDEEGARFDAIDEFLNTTDSSGQTYSVIPFSETFLSGNNPFAFCRSPFGPANEARSVLTSMRNMQNGDLATSPEAAPLWSSPFVMSNTSYFSSLMCLQQKIDADISLASDNRPFYFTFFVTDGKPTDYVDRCAQVFPFSERDKCYDENPELNDPAFSVCENSYDICTDSCSPMAPNCYSQCRTTKNQCYQQVFSDRLYVNKIRSLKQTVRDSYGTFRFIPLYYGLEGELDDARDVLDNLASEVNVNDTTLVIDDLSTLSSELSALIEPQASVNYQLESSMLVNLTAIKNGNTWVADSDIDGIADATEDLYDHLNSSMARSSGILDGACYINGNYSEEIDCSPADNSCFDTSLGGRLSMCEVRHLNTTLSTNLNGIDSDGDSIADIVEILKGSKVHISDANADYDEDGFSNKAEIVVGSDIYFANSKIIDGNHVDAKIYPTSESVNGCVDPQQKVVIRSNSLPLVETKAYVDITAQSNADFIDLSHDVNENVFAVILNMTSSGSSQVEKRQYMAIFRINKFSNDVSINLQPGDFREVGGLQP